MIISTVMIQVAVPHEYLGIATALAVTARNLGGSVGTVIYVSIFTDRLTANIPTYVAIPLAMAGVPVAELPGVVGALTGAAPPSLLAGLTPAQIEIGMAGVKQAFTHAFRIVYLSSIAFGVLGTVAVCFCNNVDEFMTKDVEIQLNEGGKFTGVTDTGEGHFIAAEEREAHKRGLRVHRKDLNITRTPNQGSAIHTPRPRSVSEAHGVSA